MYEPYVNNKDSDNEAMDGKKRKLLENLAAHNAGEISEMDDGVNDMSITKGGYFLATGPGHRAGRDQ